MHALAYTAPSPEALLLLLLLLLHGGQAPPARLLQVCSSVR